MRDMLEARKRGDVAFREKEFKTAVDCYSQVCICFLGDKNSYPLELAFLFEVPDQAFSC